MKCKLVRYKFDGVVEESTDVEKLKTMAKDLRDNDKNHIYILNQVKKEDARPNNGAEGKKEPVK